MEESSRTGINPYFALGAGVIAASFASTGIRLAQEAGMTSLSLATIRLVFVAIVLAPIGIRQGRGEFKTVTPREWGFIGLAGFLLALHFTVFISSLEYTSVLNTQVFLSTTPFFAAALAWVILKEQVSRNVMIGLLLALVGTMLINVSGEAGNPPTRDAPLLGNLLATVSALLLAMYFTLGRSIRGKINWLSYSWLVFSGAAITFLVIKLFNGTQIFGYSREAYLWALVVVLLAQMITHNAFNYALGQLSATIVGLTTMVIPVTSAIVAVLVLGENPGMLAVVGSAIILVGVALANIKR